MRLLCRACREASLLAIALQAAARRWLLLRWRAGRCRARPAAAGPRSTRDGSQPTPLAPPAPLLQRSDAAPPPSELFAPAFSLALAPDPLATGRAAAGAGAGAESSAPAPAPPGGPELFLAVGLDSGVTDFKRPRLNLVLLLDVSGSMDGGRVGRVVGLGWDSCEGSHGSLPRGASATRASSRGGCPPAAPAAPSRPSSRLWQPLSTATTTAAARRVRGATQVRRHAGGTQPAAGSPVALVASRPVACVAGPAECGAAAAQRLPAASRPPPPPARHPCAGEAGERSSQTKLEAAKEVMCAMLDRLGPEDAGAVPGCRGEGWRGPVAGVGHSSGELGCRGFTRAGRVGGRG